MKKQLPEHESMQNFFSLYQKAFVMAPWLILIDDFCEIVQPELQLKIAASGVGQKNLPYNLQTGGIILGLSINAIGANIGNICHSSFASMRLK